MSERKLCRSVLCHSVFTDKRKLPCTFIVIIQACGKPPILFSQVYEKDCGKAELPFIGKADLNAATLPGHIVYDVNRYHICSGLYGEINVARLIRCDALSVHAPKDAVSHVKSDGNVPSPDAVKDIPRNHGASVHIHVDGTAFFRLCFLGPDHIPSNLAVCTLDERLLCFLRGSVCFASRIHRRDSRFRSFLRSFVPRIGAGICGRDRGYLQNGAAAARITAVITAAGISAAVSA